MEKARTSTRLTKIARTSVLSVESTKKTTGCTIHSCLAKQLLFVCSLKVLFIVCGAETAYGETGIFTTAGRREEKKRNKNEQTQRELDRER